VAFRASLLNGKVLDDAGFGSESGIIAGMEWAAARQRARVANLSLGGFPTDGTDPMSQAITRLTARYRTLFVVAAANSGPGEQSVESPGVATAALTVGAVDAQPAPPWPPRTWPGRPRSWPSAGPTGPRPGSRRC
jgi:Subtilase family